MFSITAVLSSGKLAKQHLADNNINYWPTPAESPDLNTIEMLWHELKCFLRRVVKPSNKEELVSGIKQFWDGVLFLIVMLKTELDRVVHRKKCSVSWLLN